MKLELETVVGIDEFDRGGIIVIITEKRIINIDYEIEESTQTTIIDGVYYVWLFESDIQLRMNKEQFDILNSNLYS